ncbi:MAG: hypothetical protein MJ239_01585 [Bacilli bacterium]|nr:hypothetical protein [Bacilli bacterium]
MKNKYLQCALVLSSICVVSAGAIGALNYVAEVYKAEHQTDEAPATITALDKDALFQKVKDFVPVKTLGVTINEVYKMTKGNAFLGYAYDVDGGRPVGNNLLFTISFTGAITPETKGSVKPTAIHVVSGGDAGYTEIVQTYGDMVVNGEANLDENVKIALGSTSKSSTALQKAIKIVRDEYCDRMNGGPAKEGAYMPTLEDECNDYSLPVFSSDAVTFDMRTGFVSYLG